jgi:hypothetical protein
MFLAGAAWLIGWLSGAGAEAPAPEASAQVAVRHQIIVRVQQGTREAPPSGAQPVEWREERGPRCVPATRILGATMLGPRSVDLILRDNSRVRARLERRCPALDYYHGFYVVQTEDGQICADRDAIRSRMGGECQIDQFRSLRPIARP